MRVRITSDGNAYTTKVVNADTGERLDYVAEIDVKIRPGKENEVRLLVEEVDVDIAGEVCLKRTEYVSVEEPKGAG